MDTNQYMDMFLDESHEHLQSLNDGLLSLEDNMEDTSVVNEIFRNAHTLKGMSATMGFNKIAELTHEMEDVLDLIRKEQLKLNEDIIDTLFKCVDSLGQMIDSVGNGEAEDVVDVSDLVKKLSSISKPDQAAAQAAAPAAAAAAAPAENKISIELADVDKDVIKQAQETGMQAIHVRVTLAETCLLKSARSYMVMNALDELGDVIKSVPSAEDLEQEKFDHSFDVIIITAAEEKAVQDAVNSISEISKVETNVIDLAAEEKAAAATAAAPAPKAAAPAPTAKKAAPAPAKKATAAPAKKVHHSQSVRVDIEKLDTLMNLMGELVINKVRLEQIGQTHRLADLTETLEQMDRVTTDLQNIVMKVRMVPVSSVFNRFPRMVRDIAKELNKEINLTIEGEETELDRTVIDEIGDPIMHLLRNSCDHGVEEPDVRESKGKPRAGEVGLIARHEGNNVVIMVTDDGAGIDAAKIRAKAVEKGMISQEEADKMDDADAVRLVFLPGFSTADHISDISGRGVGMDVVRSKIEALSGHVDVETKIDEGSVFKIKLPLTLAIIQAMLVKVQEEMYAIPLGSIDSTINIQESEIKTVQNKEVIVLRGEIIPIIRMEKMLQVPHVKDSDETFVVVVHTGDAKAGIVVDNLIGQQEIVIKTLGSLFTGLKMFSGATVLGDGRVALILDVATMMQ
ncbi:MAG: chemotaxis protein CheA [Selenomonadaceae bacterium]|jgi:two-component system chemotaxis sensor kinase CheA|uniref:chemotaxis protein CheA n=1 Tax=Selenomonas bovis TaxID=416586 RepID=UPI0004E0FFCA|nr:chemotaxis protein CheA [Selenomonas bovis]MCI6751485.1 chemotaxis protein CheA [Selenomonas bovis]MDY6272306.1 chemotaxis protein CheA [Selenomonadaceae bacterium]MDY6298744.1 chemotaxis protein CheA [Selenomonadaceae bacterium]